MTEVNVINSKVFKCSVITNSSIVNSFHNVSPRQRSSNKSALVLKKFVVNYFLKVSLIILFSSVLARNLRRVFNCHVTSTSILLCMCRCHVQ